MFDGVYSVESRRLFEISPACGVRGFENWIVSFRCGMEQSFTLGIRKYGFLLIHYPIDSDENILKIE